MYSERLTNFYKAYEPSKVSQVDSFLDKYVGKEEALFRALVKKYGPEPEPSDGGDEEEDDDDDEDDDEDGGAAQPKGAAEAKPKGKSQKTKIVKQAVQQTFEQRLVAFYTKYDSSKLGIITTIMSKYGDDAEKLFKSLVKKYGKEPKAVKVIEVEVEDEDAEDECGEG